MSHSSEFAIFLRGIFFELEYDGVSPFWKPRLIASTEFLPFSLRVAFIVGTMGPATFSVSDRRNFALPTRRLIVEYVILVVRSSERGVLLRLLKMLAIAGCIVMSVLVVVIVGVVIVL